MKDARCRTQMAHIDTPTGKRRRDAAINLVPYIDLLMVLMAFLVACAAWTAMTSLPALASGGAGEPCTGASCEVGPELRVHVRAGSFAIAVGEAPGTVVDAGALAGALRHQRTLLGDRPDIAPILRVDDDASFEQVTIAVDATRAAGLQTPRIAATPG